MTQDYQEIVVLRQPQSEGNFLFWVAELDCDEATDLRRRLSKGESTEADLGNTFGRPLSLDEVMRKLQSRDFQVLDCPARLASGSH